ncbi:MAG: RDD family protein [Nanoarchaeota archaeon]|nr:RDD family protein [Nanoarchaeota archaeon]
MNQDSNYLMDLNLDLPKKKVVLGPAAIWKRALAFVIDLLLIDFIVIGPFKDVILSLAGYSTKQTWGMILTEPNNMASIMLIFALVSILALLYFVLTEYVLGQTIGKIIMKIRVVSLVPDRPWPGFGSCLIRSLFIIPVAPFYFLWIIDPIFMMFNQNSQRLT